MTRDALQSGFAAIAPLLYRYPAVDAVTFRRALDALLAEPPG